MVSTIERSGNVVEKDLYNKVVFYLEKGTTAKLTIVLISSQNKPEMKRFNRQ